MFSDYDKELLRSGIIEAKAGNKETARRYFDRSIYSSNHHDVLAEAWFWMSEVLDDHVEKRKALENCLANDLQHARARRALAILDGKLKADEIINPDKLPGAPEGVRAANAERFMCPKCGGRMAFAPDGQSLLCEYCSRNQKFSIAGPGTREQDFLIAMATARAHGKPLQQQIFHCEGCGSEFILPPSQISCNCVYCGSPHVVSWESQEELLAPDGIIPHSFEQKRAIKILLDWVRSNGIPLEKQLDSPRGIYLPLWTFDLGGTINYTGEKVDDSQIQISSKRQVRIRVEDSYPVDVNDIPIPASRKLSAVFMKLISTFELRDVKPYDPRYLVSWPAEVYDIPMAEASLDARSETYARYQRELPNLLAPVEIFSTSTANMTVEAFRLNLLPVWVTELLFNGREHLVLINGQNGIVASDLRAKKDSNGLRQWLEDFLDS